MYIHNFILILTIYSFRFSLQKIRILIMSFLQSNQKDQKIHIQDINI